jgi:hypothetical protein
MNDDTEHNLCQFAFFGAGKHDTGWFDQPINSLGVLEIIEAAAKAAITTTGVQ